MLKIITMYSGKLYTNNFEILGRVDKIPRKIYDTINY